MLFNSINFIFLFLPAVLAGYYVLALSPLAMLRRVFLIAATLVFYAFAGPQFVPLLVVSVAINFAAGKLIAQLDGSGRARGAVVALAVIANVALLGYFKYFNFLAEALGAAFGADFGIEQILLPLGISFFTFQQIGYLVDVSRGRIKAAGPIDFASFVLFFPQLLAGPIVQFGEVIEQHRRNPVWGEVGRNILIGLAIFAIGLFKKTVIADTLALYAQPVFAAARDGGEVGFVDTWIAAFAYTGQVYFDFSGYSDMAIGTARMFGIILPLNFLSPLRSKSVVEIWRRWHVTLGRWVQLYIFQPVAVPCARLAAQRGLGKYGTLALAVVVPTMLSMLIIGVWHGAGWTFVVFGLMHGAYMSVNEVWAAIRKKARKARRKAQGGPPIWRDPVARAATLLSFVLSILPFGAQGPADMWALFAGAFGGSGWLVIPEAWPFGIEAAILFTLCAYLIVFLLPNSHEIMGRFEPVLDWEADWSQRAKSPVVIQWNTTVGWALITALALFLAVAFIMRGTTEFIYFNF
ncbi:MBOAT family O-acyltransferase [uncultured Erythrobacter sp.]|uniref:MBOAT family O-acyltransferase n=1 Tax=uncultured Erythrobacter sp. TaxID=263913 RepID=UPI00263668CC|nr:MBOAT family O-acyltransferase [uncultured Erythrobacter sp.]